MILFLLLLLFKNSHSRIISNKELCKNIDCDDTTPVCGIRQEGEGFRLKLFDNECRLMENGCLVGDDEAYGIIKMWYCEMSFKTNLKEEISEESSGKGCAEVECPPDDDTEVCALETDNEGTSFRMFDNKCQLWKNNCENNTNFVETDSFKCNEMYNTIVNDTQAEGIDTKEFDTENKINISKNVVIVDNMINFNNLNESIDDFFAMTHVFDLPIQEMTEDFPGLNISGRRMRIQKAGPIKLYTPIVVIPKKIKTDVWHQPTLNSCYHKCPAKCPDTYSPVCAAPGSKAREPMLMFQNHCFMDAAQCKMKWENKLASSSHYMETTFIFCLGEELNSMYRFLPLIRSLQHMGRLKKKGRFRYKLSNLRFFNNFLKHGNPNLMG